MASCQLKKNLTSKCGEDGQTYPVCGFGMCSFAKFCHPLSELEGFTKVLPLKEQPMAYSDIHYL